ncbi:hypothetical protein [Orbus mooreae]|uniref:hypothetical protein n=1 Tax=Orbus mooreae TaxID=3074107 RepID=UPI00370CFC5D
MISSFGMRVYNDNGSSFIFDEHCSACKILGVFKYYPRTYDISRRTGIYVPEGYQEAIGFSSQSVVFSDSSSGYLKYHGLGDMSYYLDEDRQIILESGSKGTTSGNKIGEKQDCTVFAWPITASGNYGLSFSGYDNFSKITDMSDFSFLLYSGEVDINPGGWVPSSIDKSYDFDNTVIFFYWENPHASLVKYYDFSLWDGSIIDKKYVFYDQNGNGVSEIIKAKIVIFGKGSANKSKYGIRFFGNSGGDYFDVNDGVLIRPTFFSMGTQSLYDFKGVPGVNRPMILPTTIGGYAKGWQIDRAYWELGVANNGFQLAPSPAKRKYVYYNRFDPLYVVSDYPVLVLDAENYFNFGD